MNGIQNYENNIERMINNKLEKYPELTGFANYLSSKGSLTTNYNYINQVIRFLNKIDKDNSNITMDDYTGFLTSLRGKTSGYQRCAFFALKRYSEYLLYSGKTINNPMDKITAPKNIESITTKEKRENAFLTKEEVECTLSNIEYGIGSHQAKLIQERWKERDNAIILLFLSTGIRCSALFKLDMNSVNWDNSTLIVMDKGSKIHKYILPSKTMKALQDWKTKRQELLNGKEEEALFISKYRTRISQCAISDIVKKYTADIEGKHITPHKLRATFGTHLYNETRDIKFVQDQMGHTNPKITEIYIRGNQDSDRQKASDIMAKFLED